MNRDILALRNELGSLGVGANAWVAFFPAAAKVPGHRIRHRPAYGSSCSVASELLLRRSLSRWSKSPLCSQSGWARPLDIFLVLLVDLTERGV